MVIAVALTTDGSYKILRLNETILVNPVTVTGTRAEVVVLTTEAAVVTGAFCETTCRAMQKIRMPRMEIIFFIVSAFFDVASYFPDSV